MPDHAEHHSYRAGIAKILPELPLKQRAMLVLRYLSGLTDSDMAGVLGCTAGTVRGYASRALRQLKSTGIPDLEEPRKS